MSAFTLILSAILIIQTIASGADTRSSLESAYRKNPSDLSAKMAYAGVAPCSTASILYKEVAEGKTVPDSVRAEAFCRLGDLSYTSKEYPRAVEFYRNAAKINSKPVYRHYWALASLASGEIEAAQSLWHTLSLEYGDEHSQMAQYYMGLLQMKKGDYGSAYSCFLKTGAVSPEKPWSVASLAGKLECAERLGMSDKAKDYKEQLKPYRQNLLEKDLLQLSSNAVSLKTENDSAKKEPAAQDSTVRSSREGFTLQVGAFGSPENAENLQKRLSKRYTDVTVLPVSLGEQVFYRVRIGTFPTKEAAEKFASDSLAKTELNYRVVEK